ncbi:ATP-binding cassette domain-containing protein, partial [Streptomyces sp. NPDC005568]|uniref:ATP-binding cassette domain-containing protein n=1 Tax=Streptomyces sp. NPDC005568 TaxID=3156887 RepID=UPI0033AAC074
MTGDRVEHGAEPMVRVVDVHRGYGRGPSAVQALRGVSLTARRGRLTAVRGRSGAGKTTLLNIVGGLVRPDRGRVLLDGTDLSALPEARLRELRRDRVGFVFQDFGLLPVLTAAENVGVPLRSRRGPRRRRSPRGRCAPPRPRH